MDEIANIEGVRGVKKESSMRPLFENRYLSVPGVYLLNALLYL